jgi:hypothetical protein
MTDDREYPDVAQRQAERNELMRQAAQRVLDASASGKRCDPEGLQWARGIVSRFQPLGRPLSDGTPPPEGQA